LHLIIAKSFTSERNRDQGLNRCGRFGDPCVRIAFADTPLVDVKAAQKIKIAIAHEVGRLSRVKPAMKVVQAKKIATKGPTKTWMGKNPQRNEKLLATNQ
jgi:hypothetical protein